MQHELRREDLLAPPVEPRHVPPDLQRPRRALVLLHGSPWVSHAKQACESLNRQHHAQKGLSAGVVGSLLPLLEVVARSHHLKAWTRRPLLRHPLLWQRLLW